jgi:hypothetical protein
VSSEEQVFARVRLLVSEMVELRGGDLDDIANMTLRRAYLQGNITLRSLVKIADHLGFDVVINVREK